MKGPFFNNTSTEKRFKENNRKCLEITEENCYFAAEMVQNIKGVRCRFHNLKKIDFRC